MSINVHKILRDWVGALAFFNLCDIIIVISRAIHVYCIKVCPVQWDSSQWIHLKLHFSNLPFTANSLKVVLWIHSNKFPRYFKCNSSFGMSSTHREELVYFTEIFWVIERLKRIFIENLITYCMTHRIIFFFCCRLYCGRDILNRFYFMRNTSIFSS